MVPVVMVGVSVHQEFQASQEALDPRDQQVSRDHPVIMDLKDPWAHEETKVMKEHVEDRDLQAQAVTKVKKVPLALRDPKDPQVQLVPLETRVIQVLVESKVPLAPKDLKDPQVQLVPPETRVIQVLVEDKVPQVPRGIRERLVVIGNNAFSKISTMERTLD